jgi:hypothetical protein
MALTRRSYGRSVQAWRAAGQDATEHWCGDTRGRDLARVNVR